MIEYDNRCAMLASGDIPQGGVCAELGVSGGVFATHIWNTLKPRKLHLFDVWAYIGSSRNISDFGHHAEFVITQARFLDVIKHGVVVLHQGMLPESLLEMGIKFDFVYVDADHTYEACLADLRACHRVVAPGGIIAGHDYDSKEGVARAVEQFCQETNWRIHGITQNKDGPELDPDGSSHPSYLLKQA